jgi:hypothetical protein
VRGVVAAQNVAGGEAQDADAALGEPSRAVLVLGGADRMIVRGAVDLQREPGFRAVEVEHIGPDRVLTTEAEACERSAAKLAPEDRLRERHGAAEAARAVDGLRGRAHRMPPG